MYASWTHWTSVEVICSSSTIDGTATLTIVESTMIRGSKDALVSAYLRARDATWQARWEARIEAATSHRALTVFDAYAEDADPSGRGCAFINAAAELADDHPARAIVRDHKAAVRARIHRLLMDERAPQADALADHIFLLVEGAIAVQGVDGDSGHLRQARGLAASLLTR